MRIHKRQTRNTNPKTLLQSSHLVTCESTKTLSDADSVIGEARCPDGATSVEANNRKCRRARRMRRSARTLGLIIGGFVVCWLPFFVVATTMPFCPRCHVPPTVASIVLWLGYSNSLLNPAIYAIWDRSFRRAFRRIVTCDFRS